MRISCTIVGFALTACVTSTPALADGHGRPPVTTPHVDAPKTPTTPPPTTATAPATVNPIAAKIIARPQLDAKVTALLPKSMTLNQASMGFRNQGQFLAALHAAQRLRCNCFAQIRTDMTRKGMSLGQAIQDVKRSANATAVARKAETDADRDIKETTATTKKPAQGDR